MNRSKWRRGATGTGPMFSRRTSTRLRPGAGRGRRRGNAPICMQPRKALDAGDPSPALLNGFEVSRVLSSRDSTTRFGFALRVRDEAEQVCVAYDPVFNSIGPVRPEGQVEFGARATGDPNTVKPVVCAAGSWIPGSQDGRSEHSERRRPRCMSTAFRMAFEASDGRSTGTTSSALTTPKFLCGGGCLEDR